MTSSSRIALACWSLLGGLSPMSDCSAETVAGRFMIVTKGQLPVIVSAPHGGEEPLPGVRERPDRGQSGFSSLRDARTMELAQKLAAAIEKQLGLPPFTAIAKFERKHVDANRPARDAYEAPGTGGPKLVYDAYHRALADARADVLKTFGRGILLDIHGQGSQEDTIFRGTKNGQTVTQLVKEFGQEAMRGPKSILGVLAAKGYRIIPANNSNAREDPQYDGGYTVQSYGSTRGGTMDAIQLEFGSTFRTPAHLDKTADDVAAAVVLFAREYLKMKGSRPN